MPSIYFTDDEIKLLDQTCQAMIEGLKGLGVNTEVAKGLTTQLATLQHKLLTAGIETTSKKKGRPRAELPISIPKLIQLSLTHSPRQISSMIGVSARTISRLIKEHRSGSDV